ncbi:hypothetical protein BCV69DRAFT_299186 [Microstroma glucosiphilum]|uniref:Cleavage/polyadenylation specificity factor A subunit C-terminal domain-containing protein n=1 Tax=Pseudomicrostroma glucosiphilum TaxID=1684307 RepID=A0A316U635_9BASI|nr:hypothetical protein BCV69DRAFT_299186 [Pseudomicrostroma glucosiphilum]PWN20706.1 hypothetical protein BCV69DRAFT_299186 [Pseudomicrostroma glucosiphilum]
MQVVTHLHKPSTQLQSAVLPTFLDAEHPSLCIVKHSSLDFLLLPSAEGSRRATQEPLGKVAHVDVNARILAVSPFTAHGRERLAILTDHHQPRLLVLEAHPHASAGQDAAFNIVCNATILLDEMARLPAELGLGVWTVSNGGRQAVVAHTHSGILRVLPTAEVEAEQQSEYASKVFSARLPHPTILSLAPIDRPQSEDLTIALLSISSTPSSLPGLGSQCLPVLSFHSIDEAKHDLVPLPWGGPDRKVPPLIEEFKTGTSGAEASGSGSQSAKNNGPQAKGKTFTPEEIRAREQKLAKSALGRSHVPLPFADALGAHLITSLPASAGGGVIVWSETSVLIVPPPAPQGASEGQEAGQESPSTARGKRRKASVTSPGERRASQSSAKGIPPLPSSGSGSALSTSPDTAIVAHSPSSQANEHGKRRRSSAKKSSISIAAGAQPEPLDTLSNAPSDTRSKMLRLVLPRPVQITSAEIVKEGDEAVVPNQTGGRATLSVLFATMAGSLNMLEISLSRQDKSESWRPRSMKATKIGVTPRTSGPGSLTYLGEGYVHAASASGDSSIVQLLSESSGAQNDASNDTVDDVEMVSPPVSPIKSSSQRKLSTSAGPSISTALAHSQALAQNKFDADLSSSTTVAMRSIMTFPSLAPLLDFFIDGDANAPSGGTQARIIAACGSGPDGAIAVVKNGVSMEELGSLGVSDIRKLWSVDLGTCVGIVCGFAEHTQVLGLGAEGVIDVSDSTGLDLSVKTIEAASLGSGIWARVTEDAVSVVSPSGVTSTWSPSQMEGSVVGNTKIIVASFDPASSQVLLALKGGHVALLTIQGEGIALTASASLAGEVSAVSLAHGIAAVGQWKTNSVRLLSAPGLEDLTPSSMEEEEGDFGSLPRSLLVHSFDEDDGDASQKQLYLLIGLASGAVVACALALPTADSISKSIGVFDRKSSAFGLQPIRLLPFTTTQGRRAVLAINGETPTVIWAEKRRLIFSAVSYPSVMAAVPISIPGAEPTLALALPDRIQLTSIKEIGKLEISKTHLGLDNPTAIAGLGRDDRGYHRYFAVVTTPFRPEGNSTRESRPSKVILFDSVTCEPLSSIDLEPRERAGCIGMMQVDGEEYLVAGTGFVDPYESEVYSGRLIGFALKDPSGGADDKDEAVNMQLVQAFEKQVSGNVYAVTSLLGNRLVAAINSEVISYSLEDLQASSGGGAMEVDSREPQMRLRQHSRWGCAFIACTLSPIADEPQRFLVGDGLRSLCVLRVDAATGALSEIARDCDPFWTTACSSLDSKSQTFIGADISFNLFTAQRATLAPETKRRIEREAEKRRERAERGEGSAALGSSNDPPVLNVDDEVEGEWSHIMERRGAWHYGDLINRFREGSLVAKATTGTATGSGSAASTTTTAAGAAAPPIDPRLVFCTSSGALGIISTLDESASQVLSQVERNLQEYLSAPSSSASSSLAPLGEISAREYRTLRTDHRTAEPVGFIDGDVLVGAYALGLSETQKREVLDDVIGVAGGGMGEGVGVGVGKVEASKEVVDELVAALSRVC